MNEVLNWYCLSFAGFYGKSLEPIYENKYIGVSEEFISKRLIEETRKNLIEQSSILMSCSYLGKCTKEQFHDN